MARCGSGGCLMRRWIAATRRGGSVAAGETARHMLFNLNEISFIDRAISQCRRWWGGFGSAGMGPQKLAGDLVSVPFESIEQRTELVNGKTLLPDRKIS